MITAEDLYSHVRLLRDIENRQAGETATMIEYFGDWVMLEFSDGDVGLAAAPEDLERVRTAAAA